MVNISTTNVLAEQNVFQQGHGVSIGSETSGWIRNVTIRDSNLDGTALAVRIKTMRGRGGGVEDVLYENLRGKTESGIQLTLNYHSADKTNTSATPVLRRITIRNVSIETKKSDLECNGLDDSKIDGITFEGVVVTGSSSQSCSECYIAADSATKPQPKCPKPPTPPAPTPVPAPTPPTPPPTPDVQCVLTKQLSSKSSPCTLGTTFGCDHDKHQLWVTGGCRGEFMCEGKSLKLDVHGSTSERHTADCS